MDPLQSLLATQSAMPELLEHGFDGDISSAPLPEPIEGDGWVDEAEHTTDRAIFAAMVGGA
ncbi:MAG: hypothetical protein QOE06_1691 [Thermoleophilaceae bacterium]|jgi:hypothetical protein|nr:hypothetical protein [Thermoleophilaceae bacterium]